MGGGNTRGAAHASSLHTSRTMEGLHTAGDDDRLRAGAAALQQEALKHHPAQARIDVPRIQGRDDGEDAQERSADT